VKKKSEKNKIAGTKILNEIVFIFSSEKEILTSEKSSYIGTHFNSKNMIISCSMKKRDNIS